MLYEDKQGRLLNGDELDELSTWEIDEMGIHVFDDMSV